MHSPLVCYDFLIISYFPLLVNIFYNIFAVYLYFFGAIAHVFPLYSLTPAAWSKYLPDRLSFKADRVIIGTYS